MNDSISIEETVKYMNALKQGKAVGVDNVPNEILKNENLINILNQLFNLYFIHGTLPNLWYKSIICPILKPRKDYRDPYSYRSISVMSTCSSETIQLDSE